MNKEGGTSTLTEAGANSAISHLYSRLAPDISVGGSQDAAPQEDLKAPVAIDYGQDFKGKTKIIEVTQLNEE
jgi:hypothetical protein